MPRWIKAGSRVLVRKWRSDHGYGLSYNAFHGVLQEDCRNEGWDVIEVQRDSGKMQSVYAFTVEPVMKAKPLIFG